MKLIKRADERAVYLAWLTGQPLRKEDFFAQIVWMRRSARRCLAGLVVLGLIGSFTALPAWLDYTGWALGVVLAVRLAQVVTDYNWRLRRELTRAGRASSREWKAVNYSTVGGLGLAASWLFVFPYQAASNRLSAVLSILFIICAYAGLAGFLVALMMRERETIERNKTEGPAA